MLSTRNVCYIYLDWYLWHTITHAIFKKGIGREKPIFLLFFLIILSTERVLILNHCDTRQIKVSRIFQEVNELLSFYAFTSVSVNLFEYLLHNVIRSFNRHVSFFHLLSKYFSQKWIRMFYVQALIWSKSVFRP